MQYCSGKTKLALLFITVVVIGITAAGCGKKSSASGKEPAISGEGEFLIRLGHSNSPDENNIITYASTYFANRVKELTDGHVKVEIFPLNQLGSDNDQVTALQNGSQEMNYTTMQVLAPFCPPLYCFSLPYLLTEPDKVEAAVKALWDKNNEWLTKRANLRGIGYGLAGYRQLTTTSKRPIKDIPSARGLKIRIPPNAISEATFRKLGLEPVAMAYSEVFTSLQQGVVDSQENCLTAVRSDHFYEVQSYVTDIQWQYNLGMFTISEQFFQKLPPKYQEAIVQAGKEMTDKEIAKFKEMDSDDIRFLKETGKMQFLGKPVDYDKWVEIGKSVWADSYSLIGDGNAAAGKAIVDEIIAIVN